MPSGVKGSTNIATLKEMVPNAEEKFTWFVNPSKGNKSTNSKTDVSIRIGIKNRDQKTGKVKNNCYSFTFRNAVGVKFKYEYLDIAVFKTRMYFKPCKTGQFHLHSYKLKDNERCNANISIIKNENTKVMDKFCGDYNLEYDDIYEMYYIDMEKNLMV